MPREGSSYIMILGSVFSQLPMTTFCWLPPDREPTLAMMPGILISRSSTCRLANSSRRLRLMMWWSDTLSRQALHRLSRMEWIRMTP